MNVPTSFKLRAMLVDEIWHAAGDEASDIDWYVKRTVLGGIYSTTEIYMLTDRSPGMYAALFLSVIGIEYVWLVIGHIRSLVIGHIRSPWLLFTLDLYGWFNNDCLPIGKFNSYIILIWQLAVSDRFSWYLGFLGWSGERCLWFEENHSRGVSLFLYRYKHIYMTLLKLGTEILLHCCPFRS